MMTEYHVSYFSSVVCSKWRNYNRKPVQKSIYQDSAFSLGTVYDTTEETGFNFSEINRHLNGKILDSSEECLMLISKHHVEKVQTLR